MTTPVTDAEMVSIVVPTWNSERTLAACLDSILAQTWPRVEVVAVDNASQDKTRHLLEERRTIRTFLLPRNVGFAGACNRGIQESRGEYALLLNADAILSPNFLQELLADLRERPRAGAATGKILRLGGPPGRIDSTGILLQRRSFSPCDRGENEYDHGQYDGQRTVFGPSGAAALYRRAALEDVRLDAEYLDEDFFAYYEDVDLAWRLQLRGWESRYVPTAVAWHWRTGPRAQPIQIGTRYFFNRYFCYLKNEVGGNLHDYAVRRVAREGARAAWHAVRYPRILLGIPRAVALVPKMLSKRRRIQARVVAAAEALSRF